MLQAQTSAWDNRLYSVNRDVAHNFAKITETVFARLKNGAWKELDDLLIDHERASLQKLDHDLAKACQYFAVFIKSGLDYPQETFADALVRSGFDGLPPAAQIAFMAHLGHALSGVYFLGVRQAYMPKTETYPGSANPCDDLSMKALQEAAAEASRMLTLTRWQRRRLHWGVRIRRFFRDIRNAFRSPGRLVRPAA